MRNIPDLKPFLLAAAGLAAASAAQAMDLDAPFFGGGYAPPPGYAYSHGYGAAARIGGGLPVDAVGYHQGYYYGGYQYPAGGYGGGPYRRAAYSAADIYVSGGYASRYGRAYAPIYPGYRAYARGYYAPMRGYTYAPAPVYGGYYNAGYRPYRGLRQRCQCVLY